MSKIQKVALLGLLLFVALSTIILPWQYTIQPRGVSQVVKPAGYHFIFSPPKPEEDSTVYGVKLDYNLYLIQMFGGLTVFGVIFILSSKRNLS